jgi:hypothetical protein
MAVIVKPYSFSAGATIIAAEHNSNFDTIFTEFNGGIDNSNLSLTAGIVDSKLNQITTAAKVSGSALTGFASIASSAGIIPANNLPSSIVNKVVQMVYANFASVASGTTILPGDTTIPQYNEGNEYMTLAITPTVATNLIKADVTWIGASTTTANFFTIALFQDAGAGKPNAVASDMIITTGANYVTSQAFGYIGTAGTVAATTFSVRAGSTAANVTTFNGSLGTRYMGGTMASNIVLTEYAV